MLEAYNKLALGLRAYLCLVLKIKYVLGKFGKQSERVRAH